MRFDHWVRPPSSRDIDEQLLGGKWDSRRGEKGGKNVSCLKEEEEGGKRAAGPDVVKIAKTKNKKMQQESAVRHPPVREPTQFHQISLS